MKKVEHIWKYPLLLFFIGLFFMAETNTARAAENQFDISTSPILFELINEPGTNVKESIKLRNNSDTEQNLSITINKLSPNGASGEANFTEADQTDEFPQWVSLQKTTFTAPAKEWIEIPFTIAIPKTAAFGYYYGFLITPTKKEKSGKNGQTKLEAGVGIPILLNVKVPNATISAQLDNFQTKKKIYEYQPVEFETILQNTGNVHIKARGNIFIKKNNQSDIAILEVNPEKGATLPNSSRTFLTEWNDAFITREPILEDGETKLDADGKPITKITFHWDHIKNIRFGKYTASLAMVFDNGTSDTLLQGETTFWIIPYTFIAVLVILFLLIILMIRTIIRTYIKHLLKKQNSNTKPSRILNTRKKK